MRPRLLSAIIAALAVAGIAAAIGGSLPYERLQAAGALVRRAADFTPERFARYRHVCWFFAVALPALAIWLRQQYRPPRSAVSHPTPAVAPTSPASGEPTATWLVWLIVAVGCGLRLQRLFDPVAYDEAYTYLNFASRPWYEAIGDYNSTNNHLLNTLLMHISTRAFGPQEWAMRWHVLLAGSALPWAVYCWGRDWFGSGVGLIAAAAVAVSPELITYSTDARGYILVALAAIVLDASLWRLDGGHDRCARWTAWCALVAGLCAMPIMVYAAVASTAWFVITPLVERRGWGAAWARLRTAAGLGVLAVPAVGAFYAPAYIFRGLMFLNDPIMRSVAPTSVFASLASGWRDAFDWWTEGIVAGWVWGGLAVIGFAVMPSRSARVRWGFAFLTVLVLNVLQQVTPPPRIYMHLAPWLFIGAALGWLAIVRRCRCSTARSTALAALALLGAGSAYALPRPVLFHAAERADFVSVPDAITALAGSLADHPGERAVLLAPLPCDLPSIFYLRRAGIELPVNARPHPGDHVYLIARPHETPEQVLATPLLNMADLAPQFDAWLRIGAYETLTLYIATFVDPIPAPSPLAAALPLPPRATARSGQPGVVRGMMWAAER